VRSLTIRRGLSEELENCIIKAKTAPVRSLTIRKRSPQGA
jgi:hypothetical protein